MTIHVLVACSKSKSQNPPDQLIWKEGFSLENWNASWVLRGWERFEAKDLYTGRGTRKQLEIVTEHPDAVPYLISAGAGLVNVSEGVKIPSYESKFGRVGPSIDEWHLLPHGGLSNIELDEDDKVVAFAPPNYLRAISRDPDLSRVSEHLVAPMNSCLRANCLIPVRIHPRIKEVLGVASADLNTELIRIFLDAGVSGIERASDQAEDLPPPPVRNRVSDAELLEIVKEHSDGKSSMELIRFIRDHLKISASVERIGEARRHNSG